MRWRIVRRGGAVPVSHGQAVARSAATLQPIDQIWCLRVSFPADGRGHLAQTLKSHCRFATSPGVVNEQHLTEWPRDFLMPSSADEWLPERHLARS
jgi:hypothetical protein